jgi:hypothetical protein
VGLGKTTVAALVAWVFARAGTSEEGIERGRRVRILAPNGTLRRRWEHELIEHVEPLEKCAPHLEASRRLVKDRPTNLLRGSIQVGTHHHAVQKKPLACDLLIVDEAHHAKGKDSSFRKALAEQLHQAHRVLFLTATPFSIEINELAQMLQLIGAHTAVRPVKRYGAQLDRLYDRERSEPIVSSELALAQSSKEAIDAIGPFVIRHGVDDLPKERSAFGTKEPWEILVPGVQPASLGILLRTDRLFRLPEFKDRGEGRGATSPQYPVGWGFLTSRLDKEVKAAKGISFKHAQSARTAVTRATRNGALHPKAGSVALAVREVVQRAGKVGGEKVVVFCHHHSTAQEVGRAIFRTISLPAVTGLPSSDLWRSAWELIFAKEDANDEVSGRGERARIVFLDWLTSSNIQRQIASWDDRPWPSVPLALAQRLEQVSARRFTKAPSVADAARVLRSQLLDPKFSSTLPLLDSVSKSGDLSQIPGGATRRSPVVVVTDNPPAGENHLYFDGSRQVDIVLQIFNSPFGPDVLVATDRLSEGIDLHRYCRHLVHYELDPSPVRVIQREGRIRRVGSWASRIGKPIQVSYPAYGGTRDERLVQIMKSRLDAFGLLLGGAPSIPIEETEADELRRSRVLDVVRERLVKAGRRLHARAK